MHKGIGINLPQTTHNKPCRKDHMRTMALWVSVHKDGCKKKRSSVATERSIGRTPGRGPWGVNGMDGWGREGGYLFHSEWGPPNHSPPSPIPPLGGGGSPAFKKKALIGQSPMDGNGSQGISNTPPKPSAKVFPNAPTHPGPKPAQ